MRNIRKSTSEIYIHLFRLYYKYISDKDIVYILDLYHKKEQ